MAVRPFYIEADIEGRRLHLQEELQERMESTTFLSIRETKERLQLLLKLNSTPKSKMVS